MGPFPHDATPTGTGLASALRRARGLFAGRAGDLVRQIANVAGAIFQVAAAAAVGGAIGRISDENPPLVVPAGYAFTLWGPIYALSLAYAVYQALPRRRDDPLLLPRVGTSAQVCG